MWRMVVVLMMVGLCVHTAAALPGSGTQQDPWRIQSLADFDEFAAHPNYWAGFTRLQTDVNLAGRTYTTAVIAPDTDQTTYWFQGTSFTGVFDGNDHKIIGLTIKAGANDYLGLFGFIEDGEVRNLTLEGASVTGYCDVGGLVGYNVGSISNCHSTGNVSGRDYVGGLVGYNVGSISNCYSTSDVNGNSEVGGLVGTNGFFIFGYPYPGVIYNCYSIGDVNGVGIVGGLVGDNSVGFVSNCYSTGDVNGVEYVGGLVGMNGFVTPLGASGWIGNCYSTGWITASGDYVGGLVGTNDWVVEGSFWDVQTSGQTESSGGTGKMTAEMQTKSTFTEAGWDFIEIWGIGENQTYPYLRFAPAGDLNIDSKVDLFDLAILASHWLEERK